MTGLEEAVPVQRSGLDWYFVLTKPGLLVPPLRPVPAVWRVGIFAQQEDQLHPTPSHLPDWAPGPPYQLSLLEVFRLGVDQDQQVETVAAPAAARHCGVGELGQVGQPLVVSDGVEAGDLLPLAGLSGLTAQGGESQQWGEDWGGARHDWVVLSGGWQRPQQRVLTTSWQDPCQARTELSISPGLLTDPGPAGTSSHLSDQSQAALTTLHCQSHHTVTPHIVLIFYLHIL